MLGVRVTVTTIELTVNDRIMARVRRDGHRQLIPLLVLPLPDPAPAGWEWIAAYRHRSASTGGRCGA